jgi:cytochrome bd ubiquinol oxidase subunit II
MPSPDLLVASVGLTTMAALIAYALLAGPDFGAGVLDLLARGARSIDQRAAIASAMGPVWEANHVWLIFLIILLFTAYPAAFAALSIAFFVPFHLVLAGIVLRGAAFVFRTYTAASATAARAWGRVFGIASLVTPLLLGATLAATATGDVRVLAGRLQPGAELAWLQPFPLALGGLTVLLCAYVAALRLVLVTRGRLREDFRRNGLAIGLLAGVVAVGALVLVVGSAPRLWQALTSVRAAPVLLLGVLLAPTSLAALWQRRYRLARALALGQIVLLLLAWALAQWPYIIYPDLSLQASAAPPATLGFVLATLPLGMGLVVPSLWLLFAVFRDGNPGRRTTGIEG